MPIYDYQCAACGHRFEAIHGVHADGPSACPACGSTGVRKAFVAPAIHFKGSGWAKRDRRATSTPAASKAAPGDASDGAGGGTTSGSDGAAAGATNGSDGATPDGTPAAAAGASGD